MSRSRIQNELDRGEYLAAADLGLEALGADPTSTDLELVRLTGLALARCGATDGADDLLSRSRAVERSASAPSSLRNEMLALRARILKDRALQNACDDPQRAASEAAEAYERAATGSGDGYAIVNAATMYLVAGEPDRSRALASAFISTNVEADQSAVGEQAFWQLASMAEARLLLGQPEEAAECLQQAMEYGPSWGMLATTTSQNRLVCELVGVDLAALEPLRMPSIVHYTGHMFSSGPDERIRAGVRAALLEHRVGAAYGALACGSDILIAESVVEAGLELHVRLPCPVNDFLARSVRPGGENWVERFHRIRRRAASFEFDPAQAMDDPVLFTYGDQWAMGLALLRARQLGSDVSQIAVWDGVAGEVGTAHAVAAWRRAEAAGRTSSRRARGSGSIVIPFDRSEGIDIDRSTADLPTDASTPDWPRTIRALAFLDVTGFSGRSERELPVFFEEMMAEVAQKLDEFGDAVLYRNTWGDAIYLVFDGVTAAAECVLAIQETLKGLPGPVSARIGCHAGPVFQGVDHIRGSTSFYGTHVIRAARIEPRTPPGEVYVTASFASLLALEGERTLRMEYVGTLPTAKDYGTFPMFSLRR